MFYSYSCRDCFWIFSETFFTSQIRLANIIVIPNLPYSWQNSFVSLLNFIISVYVRVCMRVLSHVRLFATPWTVARLAPPTMRILQARILEWVAMSSSSGSSQPRDHTQVSHIAGGFFTVWATREALLQGAVTGKF